MIERGTGSDSPEKLRQPKGDVFVPVSAVLELIQRSPLLEVQKEKLLTLLEGGDGKVLGRISIAGFWALLKLPLASPKKRPHF